MRQRSLNYLMMVIVSVVFIGCSSIMEPTPSGFLGDYSTMQPSKIIKGMSIDRASSEKLGDYSKFIIDPVEIYLHKDAKAEDIDPKVLQEMADYFRNEVIAKLQEHYTVVEEAGVGVLRIRAAITDVLPNKVALNIHWSTTMAGLGLGGAAMEAEFVDSQTNERILAVIDSRKGRRTHYKKGLSKWGHTKDVIEEWVQMLTKRLDELHDIKQE